MPNRLTGAHRTHTRHKNGLSKVVRKLRRRHGLTLIERISVKGRWIGPRHFFARAGELHLASSRSFGQERFVVGQVSWIIGAALTTEDLTRMSTFRLTLRSKLHSYSKPSFVPHLA